MANLVRPETECFHVASGPYPIWRCIGTWAVPACLGDASAPRADALHRFTLICFCWIWNSEETIWWTWKDERRWHGGMRRYGCNVIRMGWGVFVYREEPLVGEDPWERFRNIVHLGIESQSRRYQYRMNASSSPSSVPATTRFQWTNLTTRCSCVWDLLLKQHLAFGIISACDS